MNNSTNSTSTNHEKPWLDPDYQVVLYLVVIALACSAIFSFGALAVLCVNDKIRRKTITTCLSCLWRREPSDARYFRITEGDRREQELMQELDDMRRSDNK